MKKFLSEYGFTIIAAIVIITLVTFSSPIGSTIKKETSNLVDSFGVVSEVKMDQLDNSLWEAGKSELTIKIIGRNHVNYLYDVGEANLTSDDIVQINGVDCYVLRVENDKALLITKDIYDARFDTGGHTAEDTDNHVGTDYYADKTYDYKFSTLRTWMNVFYKTQLGADSRILPTDVMYYTYKYDGNLDLYTIGTIKEQFVFAIDAKEAMQYASKFKWNNNQRYNYAFWTTAGCYPSNGVSYAWYVNFEGSFYSNHVDKFSIGARPAFWLSLE